MICKNKKTFNTCINTYTQTNAHSKEYEVCVTNCKKICGIQTISKA